MGLESSLRTGYWNSLVVPTDHPTSNLASPSSCRDFPTPPMTLEIYRIYIT